MEAFMPLIKVDAAKRIVYARLDETPDRANEVFDYASSKPYFEEWSNDIKKVSGGRSLGNVRAQHRAVGGEAGKVERIDYDDQGKAIGFMIKVVDDDAWRKCEEGVYTGISPGGKYMKVWNDGAYRRYTAKPGEISLVDRVTVPTATFTLVKADGTEEQRPFKTTEPASESGDGLAKAFGALLQTKSRDEYRAVVLAQPAAIVAQLFPTVELQKLAEGQGLAKRHWSADERKEAEKKGHAMEGGSFPIEDAADVEAAVRLYGHAGDKAAAKAFIIKRAKAIGATDELPADWDGSTKKVEKAAGGSAPDMDLGAGRAGVDDLRKGLDDAAQFASMIGTLTWLCQCAADEKRWEGDKSTIPGRLAKLIGDAIAIANDWFGEETSEAIASLKTALAGLPDTIKKAAESGDLNKIFSAGDLAKVAGQLAVAREDLAKASDENKALKARVAEFEKKPAAGGPLRTIVKGDELQKADEAGDKEIRDALALGQTPEGALAMTKLALKHGRQLILP